MAQQALLHVATFHMKLFDLHVKYNTVFKCTKACKTMQKSAIFFCYRLFSQIIQTSTEKNSCDLKIKIDSNSETISFKL